MRDKNIRATFAAFLGSKDYVEFLGWMNTGDPDKRRVRLAQATQWRRFLATNPNVKEQTDEELLELFCVCPAHGTRLRHGKARLVYGLHRYPGWYWWLKERFFPYSRLTSGGGCMCRDHAPNSTRVLFCPRCRFNAVTMIFPLLYV